MFDNGGRGGSRDSDEDDDFFKPSASGGKSTLAKIFGISTKTASGSTSNDRASGLPVAPKPIKVSDRYGPSNFRYIPSQQAEATVEPASDDAGKPAEWSIVRATVVTAYKLVEEDNVFLGKVGLALLDSSAGHRLLLYRTKTEVLGAVTFTAKTKLFLKQDYLQFRTDESNNFWSVLFESESDRQAMLAVLESWCTGIEREPLIEEPLSEAEKGPEPPSNSRSNLVARMARMGGQAMPLPERAPKAPPIPPAGPGSDSSDTSDQAQIDTLAKRPIRRQNMQMIPLTGMVTGGGGVVGGGGKVHNNNTPGPQGPPPMADVNFNLIMSETRMQNTEMRMNISKLESKLDRVLDRIDLLSVVQGPTAERSVVGPDPEGQMIALEMNLLQLKRENHSLRSKVRSLEAAETERRRNNAETVLAAQKVQEMEATEKRSQEEIADLKARLAGALPECLRAKETVRELEDRLATMQRSALENTKECESFREQLRVAQAERDTLAEQLADERRRSVDEKTLIELLRKENESLKATATSASDSSTTNGAMVKGIMNRCYQQISDQITDPQVLRCVAQIIKRETKAALDREKGANK